MSFSSYLILYSDEVDRSLVEILVRIVAKEKYWYAYCLVGAGLLCCASASIACTRLYQAIGRCSTKTDENGFAAFRPIQCRRRSGHLGSSSCPCSTHMLAAKGLTSCPTSTWCLVGMARCASFRTRVYCGAIVSRWTRRDHPRRVGQRVLPRPGDRRRAAALRPEELFNNGPLDAVVVWLYPVRRQRRRVLGGLRGVHDPHERAGGSGKSTGERGSQRPEAARAGTWW
jgi:hypothetical protein